jgi:hypothetical protein
VKTPFDTTRIVRPLIAVAAAALLLAGCKGGGGASASVATSPPATVSAAPVAAAPQAPAINGSPRQSVRVGEAFEFVPIASDPAGLRLTFDIANRPAWAGFDPVSGRLSGTPAKGDAGAYERIRITVSNGAASASLPEFSVQVVDASTGQVTIGWDPPTDNVDGSPLTDLAGYRVYYGRSPGALSNRLEIANAGATTAVIENLGPATWYFSVAAYTSGNVEGERSAPASRLVM